ncbi:MAG: hypothetical protein ACERKY_10340 [Anaerolineales bacterium]
MIFRNTCCRFFARTILLILALLLVSCGGGDPEIPVVEGPPSADLAGQGDSSGSDDDAQEAEFDTSMVQVVELPADFPDNFPIPDGATISSNVSTPDDGDFRMFITLLLPLEEALAYYQSELPAVGWTIIEEGTSNRGTEMEITNSEYAGELLFVNAGTGVALDVHLFPLGTGDAIPPDLAEGLGESTSLGDSESSFPSDLPIPTDFTPIELSGTLHNEGYKLAFKYVGVAEMAMIELNIAMITAGWEIGEPIIGDVSGVYIVPFENLGSGFAGYAYITNNPGQFNVDTGGAVLIALAPGQP